MPLAGRYTHRNDKQHDVLDHKILWEAVLAFLLPIHPTPLSDTCKCCSSSIQATFRLKQTQFRERNLSLPVPLLQLDQLQQALVDQRQQPMTLAGHDPHAPHNCTGGCAEVSSHSTRCDTCAMPVAVTAPSVFIVDVVYRIIATEQCTA